MTEAENQYSTVPHDDFEAMSGDDVRALMREKNVTIRVFSKTNGLTIKRTRQLRERGVSAKGAAWELHWMVEESRIGRVAPATTFVRPDGEIHDIR